MELVNLFLKAVFIENILLAFFLGMCSYLAVSRKLDTAIGLGFAVIFVLSITCPVNWVINYYLLDESTNIFALDLSYLRFVVFIAVIAAMVQLVEMVIEKISSSLYNSLGIFLPLIAVNCAILGASLFMQERKYDFTESVVFGFGSGVGWFLAIVAFASIREKIRYSHIPKGLRGLGLSFIMTGLMAMAFMAFSGIQL